LGLFVVAVVVVVWPIQVVTIVVIFGLLVLFDDLEGGIGLDAARLSSASLAKIFGKVQRRNRRSGFAGAALQEIKNSFRHRAFSNFTEATRQSRAEPDDIVVFYNTSSGSPDQGFYGWAIILE
jgi:hypothetical protein